MSKLLSRLEWTWRLVMTGLCFALFGLGGLLLSVVWFNILLVLVWDTSRRRRLARRSQSSHTDRLRAAGVSHARN